MSMRAGLAGISAVVSFGLLLIPPGEAHAQAMHKCLKGTAVTYSNTPCDQLGLKSAGQVRDRLTTVPGATAQAKGPSGGGAGGGGGGGKPQSGVAKENQIDMPPTSSVKPINPLIQKLSK